MKIERNAVLHIPCSQYAFAADEKNLTIRLRAARGNLSACTLYYGDRAFDKTPVICQPLPMEIVAQDSLHTYYEATIHNADARVCYYFRLETDEEWCYIYSDRFSQQLPEFTLEGIPVDERSELYQYPYILRTELAAVPAWLKQAKVYNIFPDSFASEKESLQRKVEAVNLADGTTVRSRLGGTLHGVMENLEHIAGLGCNCIYLNPIFQAESYHKYDVTDYFHIDPCFGTNEDLRLLAEKAHSMGLRVILDGVFNHTSSSFFAFRDVVEKGADSQYRDWYYDVSCPVRQKAEDGKPNYACFAYVPQMPKLNTANPKVQEYFAEVGQFWIRTCGIDGWRLDVANEVAKEFWRCFKKAVRRANPDAVLIGEVWENAKDWQGPELFDSVMNYDFRDACRDFFALGKLDAAEFNDRVTDLRMRYPADYWRAQLNLLDSHDVCRFLSLCGADGRRLEDAVLFQMLYPGVPSVFYGDEDGITGVTENAYRAAMPWRARNKEREAFYRQALALHDLPAVQKGSFRTIRANPGEKLYGFSLSCTEQALNVWIQAGSETAALVLPENARILAENGYENGTLQPFGWCVVEK